MKKRRCCVLSLDRKNQVDLSDWTAILSWFSSLRMKGRCCCVNSLINKKRFLYSTVWKLSKEPSAACSAHLCGTGSPLGVSSVTWTNPVTNAINQNQWWCLSSTAACSLCTYDDFLLYLLQQRRRLWGHWPLALKSGWWKPFQRFLQLGWNDAISCTA